ncbi:MAG: TolC family protein [Bacteroidota bacterium]
MKYIIAIILFAGSMRVSAQDTIAVPKQTLSFEEYLGYVKKYHPLIKQADLTLSLGEANLLKARGGFDPKIEVDYDRKKFESTEYYDQLNATFNIPTWYGIEFKANFEENTGAFLNPNLSVPEGGLYSAGVSFSLAQGFLINERMATLKKARFFREQTQADRELLVNNLIFAASNAYFMWLEASTEEQIYQTFLENATVRLDAVQRSVEVGETPAIDITEARIALQNRELGLEAARLKRRKAALEVSNFLWLDEVPLELQEQVIPVSPEIELVQSSLALVNVAVLSTMIENHPKLRSLDAKIDGLDVDRSLKRNKLLPKLDLQYNFLSPEYDQVSSFNTANYKAFLNFSFPLFLRKERGDLRVAQAKLQEANYERISASLSIRNKIEASYAEINSLGSQNDLVQNIVIDYESLLTAEERKFFLGESSLFLINSREQKLIDARLKQNEVSVKQLTAIASLYNALGMSENGSNNNP